MALDHPSPATRCGEELKTTGGEMGSREEAETESGGQGGAVSALEAPLVSPASPSWKTSPGASPSIPFIPCLGPSEDPQASGAQTRDSQSSQLGPLPLTRDIPSPTGNQGERSRVRAFGAARSQPRSAPAPRFRRGKEAFQVPPRAGALKGLRGPRRRAMLSL